MSLQQARTYLITGCSRGIGRALAGLVLARPHTLLIGLIRNPESEQSQSLKELPRADGSKVVLLRYDASDANSAASAVAQLHQEHPEIDHIDVAVANAGVAQYFGPALEATPETYLEHFQINTLGPLTLFKALLPMLRMPESTGRKAKFIAISSAIGSTGLIPSRARGGGALPYGMSKAALNHGIARLRFDHPEIAFRVLTPGATKTEFGGGKVDWSKIPHARTIEEVVPPLLERIDEFSDNPQDANVEFRNWDGSVVPW